MRRFANVVGSGRRGILIDPRCVNLRKLLILRLWIGNRNIGSSTWTFSMNDLKSGAIICRCGILALCRQLPWRPPLRGHRPWPAETDSRLQNGRYGQNRPAEWYHRGGPHYRGSQRREVAGLPYQAAIEKLVKASWPKALVFCKSHIENENGRRQATQLEREQSAKHFQIKIQ